MKSKSRHYFWLFCIVQSLNCRQAFSEDLDIKKDPVTIPIGIFDLSPVFEVGETFNDNIFRRDNAKRSSFVTQINAGAQLARKHKQNRYLLTYALQSSQYHSSPQDDFVDQYIGINTHNEFTRRNRLDLDFSFLNSHFMRGNFLDRDVTTPTLTVSEPDQYYQYNAKARYRYGLNEAKGNLEVQTDFADYTFDNNRKFTASQDRSAAGLTVGFNYRAFPNTTLRTQIESIWTVHKEASAAAFDNNKQRFLIGDTWLYSAKLQADVKMGYLRLAVDSPSINISEYNDITWDVNVLWSPFKYSQLNFNASRNAGVSVNSANIRTSDRYSMKWVHEWSGQISTTLNTSYESANNLAVKRKDDFLSFGLDLNYGVRRWLGFGINYTSRDLQSDSQTLDFNQNTILFYVTGNPRLSDDVKTPWNTWY